MNLALQLYTVLLLISDLKQEQKFNSEFLYELQNVVMHKVNFEMSQHAKNTHKVQTKNIALLSDVL